MRALILAGGEGSRLRPLTHTNAKQLIPVAGAPILFHALEAIRDAGITDVGIVIGQTGDEIRAAVGDGAAWGLSVTYVPQDRPLGLAHAVLTSRDFVAGEPFLMYLGDNVLLEGLRRFVEEFERTRPDAQIFLAKVPEPERFGVAEVHGERIVGIEEKPHQPKSNYAVTGIYMYDASVFDKIKTLVPSNRGELEITDVNNAYIREGTLSFSFLDGWWTDAGTFESLLRATNLVAQWAPKETRADL